jgi:hypothetical protein
MMSHLRDEQRVVVLETELKRLHKRLAALEKTVAQLSVYEEANGKIALLAARTP